MMKRAAIAPYIILSMLYALVISACYIGLTVWYSEIPERVVLFHNVAHFSIVAIIVLIGLLLMAVGGATVLYNLKLISKTWLVVYIVAPIPLGVIFVELFLLFALRSH